MRGFETKTIEDVTQTLIDYRGKTPAKTASGIKLITAKVIKGGRILDDNHEFIAEDNYDSWMRRGLPQKGDILITTEAPLGEVAQLRTPEKIALAQRVILLRGNPAVIDQSYYFQALKSSFVQGELSARATGTTVLGIKQSELWKVKIPYFSLPTQRKIAAILTAYDDLIENNIRRIQLLRSQAKLLFSHYEQLSLSTTMRRTLGEISDEVGGTIRTGPFGSQLHESDYTEHGIPVVMPKNIIDGRVRAEGIARIPEEIAARLSQHALGVGDIVYGRRGDIGRRGFIGESQKGWLCGTGCLRISLKGSVLHPKYLYEYLGKSDVIEMIAGRAIGATMPNLNTSILRDIPIMTPPYALQKAFADQVEPIDGLLENLEARNSLLRQTRDLLLPKLISGEVDVYALGINTGESTAQQ